MKKIGYITFIFLVSIIFSSQVFAGSTSNGVSIIDNNDSNDNTFSLYCIYKNDDYVLIDRSATDDKGNIEASISIPFTDASNATLKKNNFMNSDGSLDCPKYMEINRQTSEVIGFVNSYDVKDTSKSHFSLDKENSVCTGKCNGSQKTSLDSGNTSDSTSKTKGTGESFENFCSIKGVKNSMKFIGSLLFIVKIIVPILLIIFGAIDFGKATISYDADAIQKATKTLVTRVIAGIVIFLIPTIVNFVFDDLINVKTGYDECRVCIFSPGRC